MNLPLNPDPTQSSQTPAGQAGDNQQVQPPAEGPTAQSEPVRDQQDHPAGVQAAEAAATAEEPIVFGPVGSEECKIPFNKIRRQDEVYAFRKEDELDPTNPQMTQLIEGIRRVGGLTVPLLVRRDMSGLFLAADGHRRLTAIQHLIEEQIEGFTRDMLLPAHVLEPETSDVALVVRAISANVDRSAPSLLGRIRGTVALRNYGMPVSQIAGIYGVGHSTTQRDLLVGGDEDVMGWVNEEAIGATAAAALVKAATDAKRLQEWKEEFRRWRTDAQKQIDDNERRRAENDESSLTQSERKLEKLLTAEQIEAWKESLRAGKAFAPPTFRYQAHIKEEGRKQTIVIDSLKADIDELPVKDLAKVYKRIVDLGAKIEPVLRRKAEEERQAGTITPSGIGESRARQRLTELGLHELLEPEEPDAEAVKSLAAAGEEPGSGEQAPESPQ